jgi:uncharacterized membrane protein
MCTAGSALACLMSVALWRRTRTGGALPGCGAQSGCDDVLASRWSRVGPIPAAGAGAAVYAALTAGFAGIAAGILPPALVPAVTAMVVLAGGAAVWFLALQFVVLHRVCGYCTAVHALGLGVAVVWLAHELSRGASMAPAALGGAIGALLLVAVQVAGRPPTHVVREFTGEVSPRGPRTTEPTEFETSSRPPKGPQAEPWREIRLLGGRLRLIAGEWPRLGPADAEHVVACLFDYTCSTCRRTHRALARAVERAGGRLAVLLLPTPMDPSCNPQATRVDGVNLYACRYARLGLRVWRGAPVRFAEYDGWVCESDELPPLGLALQWATELAGAEPPDPSYPDPAVDGTITTAIKIYKSIAIGRVPALLLGTRAIVGEITSPEIVLDALNIGATS